MDSHFRLWLFFSGHHLSSVGFTLLPLQVLDDRARDERLVTLLQKYHSSKRYSLFFIHTNNFLNLFVVFHSESDPAGGYSLNRLGLFLLLLLKYVQS